MTITLEAPMYVSWNYTYACNFNCTHCYSRADWYPKELSTSQYKSIAKQIVDAGVFTVGFGGGEPLLRRDIFAIIDILHSGGVRTNLTTNGWFVDEQTARQLRSVGLNELYVSIDHPEASVHDRFRRMDGSYIRARNAIRAAAAAGLTVWLSTVITSLNHDKLDALADLAAEDGAFGVQLKRFRPAGNGLLYASQYTLSSEEEALLMTSVSKLTTRKDIRIQFIYRDGDPEGAGLCPCGTASITIRPNGDVSPCSYGGQVIGNVLETPLLEIWRNSPELNAIRKHGGCLGHISPLGSSRP